MNTTFSNVGYITPFLVMYLMLILGCKAANTEAKGDEFVISFGSCNHQWEKSQPIWTEISQLQPDLWIWLGDIIYADTDDMSKMKEDYRAQTLNRDYSEFASKTDVIGIWDDHDYGSNNAGKEYAQKDNSKLLLFDFLDVADDDPARKRSGAYQSYIYQRGELLVKVILLDARYFRDSIEDPDGTILGEQQWSWLANELSVTNADTHVIAGGIQFLPEDHRFEKWANFPKERQRLINLIDSLSVLNPILISGDRHIGEMSLISLPNSQKPLIEITSSGLTHAYTSFSGEENRHRIGHVTASINFGLLTITKLDGVTSYACEIRNGRGQIQSVTSDAELPGLLQEQVESRK